MTDGYEDPLPEVRVGAAAQCPVGVHLRTQLEYVRHARSVPGLWQSVARNAMPGVPKLVAASRLVSRLAAR